MNILFVCYQDYRANSMVHIAGFTAGLRRLGHTCAVAVPEKPHTLSAVPSPTFIPLLYADILKNPDRFPDGRPPDIIHAWTPRWHVADFVLALQRRLTKPARLVVHLEDNEEHLAEKIAGRPFAELRRARPDELKPLRDWRLVHPWRHRLFLHAADAVTHITPALEKFIPAGRPAPVLRPAVAPAFFRINTPDTDQRRLLGLPPGARVIVYPGGVNPINAPEIRDIYAAAALLDTEASPVRLVRTGASPDWFADDLTPRERAVTIDLGFVDRDRIAPLLSLADVLVQPGRPGPFNDYRLPSKLAEFLACGKPVVMPATNIAAELRDGRDALFLHEGTPPEIAARCREIFDDPGLARRLGENARAAALRLFDPERQTALLAKLYEETLARPATADWTAFAAPDADERALFPASPQNAPDLLAALEWLQAQTPSPRPWWRRLLRSFR